MNPLVRIILAVAIVLTWLLFISIVSQRWPDKRRGFDFVAGYGAACLFIGITADVRFFQ
jgi:hypothetical protein